LRRQFYASDITFMDEREGAQERRLKEAIAVLLDLDATVVRAYLVCANYNGVIGGAMLGLLTRDRQESGKLALQMDRACGALFDTEAHLDVVFLDDEDDAQFREACAPFYNRLTRYH
jgi:hypothetical protein